MCLPMLDRAACAGYLPAQMRVGYYVVGYWITDEQFWPSRRKLAVSALAMLLVAAKRSSDSIDALLCTLARDPVVFSESRGVPPLPSERVKVALIEAAR